MFHTHTLCTIEVYRVTCCTGPCAAAARFDPKMTERDLRRYQRRGSDASTRILVSELRRWCKWYNIRRVRRG